MALCKPISHGQTETSAPITFGGIERLKAMLACFFGHPMAIVYNLQRNLVLAFFALDELRSKRDHPAFVHRVHCVENQIREYFAQLAAHAENGANFWIKLLEELDDNTALLRHILPPGTAELSCLSNQIVKGDRR